MDKKTIKLLDPIKGHQGQIHEVTLRPPVYRDYVVLGDAEIFVPLKEGGGIFQTDFPVVARYVEKLMEGDSLLIISQLSLADGMRVKDAVVNFFREAMMRTGDWTTRGTSSPEDSSSPTDNPSAVSAA